jgi:hypothetical protein
MNYTKTGGPAFPLAIDNQVLHEGMTLQDLFAAKALQTLLLDDSYDFSDRDLIARKAYAYADAMLRAREAA